MGGLEDFDIEEKAEVLLPIENDAQAITIAEQAEITKAEKKILFKQAIIMSIILTLISAALMAGFKTNEGFFDAASRSNCFAETNIKEQENIKYPKINVNADFVNEDKMQFVLPLKNMVAKDKIEYRHELISNKLIITIKDGAEIIPDQISVITDSAVMDAVGIYRQNTDIVVEIFCNDIYNWNVALDTDKIVVDFSKFIDTYNSIVVVYVPFEEKYRLDIPEWEQQFHKIADENNIKLILAYEQEEEYTEKQVVDFANKIKADMLLGIDVMWAGDINSGVFETVYNEDYFIPEYSSIDLAVDFTEEILSNTSYSILDFKAAKEEDLLVYTAKIPAAVLKLKLPQKDVQNESKNYRYNESLEKALEKMVLNKRNN